MEVIRRCGGGASPLAGGEEAAGLCSNNQVRAQCSQNAARAAHGHISLTPAPPPTWSHAISWYPRLLFRLAEKELLLARRTLWFAESICLCAADHLHLTNALGDLGLLIDTLGEARFKLRRDAVVQG